MKFFTPKHISTIDVYDQSIVCPDIPTRAVMTSFSSELLYLQVSNRNQKQMPSVQSGYYMIAVAH